MPRYFSSDKHNLIHGWKILALIVVSLATGAWKAFSFRSSTALFIRKAFRSSRNTRSINGNLHYQSKTLLLMSQQPLNETALAPANLAAVDPFEDWKLKKKSSTGIIPAGPDALASIEKAEGLPDDEYQKPKDRSVLLCNTHSD